MTAAGDLPVLIVGDVHGDLERLFEALKPYPAEIWRTVFVGDLIDYGLFGVGTLRFARDRPNTTVLLGNHEVAMDVADDQDREVAGGRHRPPAADLTPNGRNPAAAMARSYWVEFAFGR